MLLVLPSSPELGFQGIVDLIVKTEDSEYIPVDYKNMASDHGRAWMDHKYPPTAYALLVDDQFRTRVRRGFINYIPEDLNIKRIVDEEVLPPIRVAPKKCSGGCGYEQACQH